MYDGQRMKQALTLVLLLAGTAGAQTTYIERDVCPGESCSLGAMTALINIPVYKSDSYTGGIQFFIESGAEFTVLSITLHHEPVGMAIVRRHTQVPLEDDTVPLFLQPGDTIRILGALGEGRYTIIARDRKVAARSFWEDPYEWPLRVNPPARLLWPPHTHSWYQVKTKAGRIGWCLWEPNAAAPPDEK